MSTLQEINADLARMPDLRPVLMGWAKDQHSRATRALRAGTTGGDSPAPFAPLRPFTLAVKRFCGLHLQPGRATGEMLALYASPSAIRIAADGKSATIAAPSTQTRKKVGLFVSIFTQRATKKQATFLTALAREVGYPGRFRAGQSIHHPGRDFTQLSAKAADAAAARAAEHVLRSWGFA